MNTLRQKWIDFYPVMFGIAFILGIAYLGIVGIGSLAKAIDNAERTPDPRTVEEILEQKYKKCIITAQPDDLDYCQVYLKAKNNQ